MAEIKLFYFDLRARGEPARLVLAAAGKKWTDVRLTFAEWPSEKPKAPYGQVPYMEYNGKIYAQSLAIAGFLAKEFGLYGKTNLDELRIQEVQGLVEDMMRPLIDSTIGPEDTKPEAIKKMIEEVIPKFMGFFERLLKENGSNGFFVGNSLTVADLAVYDITVTLEKIKPGVLSSYSEVQKLRSVVSEVPNLKTYLAERKDIHF